jgi:hypothetical protein
LPTRPCPANSPALMHSAPFARGTKRHHVGRRLQDALNLPRQCFKSSALLVAKWVPIVNTPHAANDVAETSLRTVGRNARPRHERACGSAEIVNCPPRQGVLGRIIAALGGHCPKPVQHARIKLRLMAGKVADPRCAAEREHPIPRADLRYAAQHVLSRGR